jgi:hypothetical protein
VSFPQEEPGPHAWGKLKSAEALLEGDVDAFILRWCQNACASNWLDTVVLSAIILNTILLVSARSSQTPTYLDANTTRPLGRWLVGRRWRTLPTCWMWRR